MEAINSLSAEIRARAAVSDGAGRKETLNSLRDLQSSIEKLEDAMQKVTYLVSPPEHGAFQRCFQRCLSQKKLGFYPILFDVDPQWHLVFSAAHLISKRVQLEGLILCARLTFASRISLSTIRVSLNQE
jgi:hypothetical protein